MTAKKRTAAEPAGRALVGMKEIREYTRRAPATILSWIRDMDFPAKKISGQWESNTALIDAWKIRQIQS